jgi:hypothetical protein
LSHCFLKLKDFPKWKESFKAWYKNGKRSAEDSKDKEVPAKGVAYKDRSRGHKASKTDLHHQALSIALENTLNTGAIRSRKEQGIAPPAQLSPKYLPPFVYVWLFLVCIVPYVVGLFVVSYSLFVACLLDCSIVDSCLC